jgi:phosphoribosylaminoimidazolecarboxamide formyltransferase/IMP cyclohydrolase
MHKALISVYNRKGINALSKFLINKGHDIIASSGTSHYLKQQLRVPEYTNNIKSIEDIINFPHILDGRVKTLHPYIHGGLLATSHNKNHLYDLTSHNIDKISIAAVNLYPFKETITKVNITECELIEQLDIGGHTMIRSAAKNFESNVILTSHEQYNYFINNYTDIMDCVEHRRELAIDALQYITDYDIDIANYFNNNRKPLSYDKGAKQTKPKMYQSYTKQHDFKYGANPHQDNAALWTVQDEQMPFDILNGNLGFINTLDAINSWGAVCEIYKTTSKISAASFKHTSPAGISVCREMDPVERRATFTKDIEHANPACNAYILARNVDPKSSFGDFIAISAIIDTIAAKRILTEVSDGIIAYGYTDEALKILKKKKNGTFVILKGDLDYFNTKLEMKQYSNITLTQPANTAIITEDIIYNSIYTKNNIIDVQPVEDLLIANIALKYAQSNSVALAKNGTLLGLAAGQQSRVDCVKIACEKALMYTLKSHPDVNKLFNNFNKSVKRNDKTNAIIKYIENDFTPHEYNAWTTLFKNPPKQFNSELKLLTQINMKGISMASDAFIPFRDNIDIAHKYGVKYIIQPGGSIQDKTILEVCNDYNMVMTFTNKRMFLH